MDNINKQILNREIDLCVFISSKNRFLRTSDYKVTIKSFAKLIDLNLFKNKFVNIKIFKGDEENADDIINFFKKYNFIINIIEDDLNITNTDRYENRAKFISSISKDLATFFLQNKNNFSEYLFILEDDSPIIIKNGKLTDFINTSFKELENDKDIEAIHFLRLSHNNIPTSVEEWFVKHNLEILPESEKFLKIGYWYNFQPRVVRKKDIIETSSIVIDNWETYQYMHPEEVYSNAYKKLNYNIKFHAFSPRDGYSIDLGTEPNFHFQTLNSEPEILYTYFQI
jgi:hypothetical protein